MACVFCDIVQRITASHVIYEDEEFIAILDKYPISIGHTLVMPKKHYARVNDLTDQQFCALYLRVHALNRLITARLGAVASHISVNDGAAANQLVPHVHVHIIPRNVDDHAGFTARKLLRADEMDEIKGKLEAKDLKITS